MAVDRSSSANRHSLALFFILAYALSWAVEIPLALQVQGLIAVPISWSLHYLAAYGPLLAAVIVIGVTTGREGLQELFGRMLKWRVRPIWWLVALAPLVLYALLALVLRFIPGQSAGLAALGQIDFLPDLGAGAPFVWLLTFGLGEETGWRGYALPRLQQGRSALSATVILWTLWALWHLPLFFYLYDATILVGFLLGLLAGAIVFTWLYNSTGGSVLLVAVWHAAFNFVTGCLACKTGVAAAVVSTVVMVWAVIVVIWSRPAALSRIGKPVH
ncbi:MAG: CPBP family intramembrane metalloprotease [Anaerolineae bacterium]|nr:CPBP family intramembrane metalloprotease [Anaerolineae bacterium]